VLVLYMLSTAVPESANPPKAFDIKLSNRQKHDHYITQCRGKLLLAKGQHPIANSQLRQLSTDQEPRQTESNTLRLSHS
jgi:hypothetical protein